MAIAKNISKIPITIKAIFIRLVIVELVDFWLLDTLLTVDDTVLDELAKFCEVADVFALVEELSLWFSVEFPWSYRCVRNNCIVCILG